jgi:SP family arabinose:H+ symporter-like MFS transporter
VIYLVLSGVMVLVLMMQYIATFAFTLGPVVWILISEMFPGEIRGRAIPYKNVALTLFDYAIL